jgi:hypothetical protein
MKIPADAVISDDKLSRYLLHPRPRDDKSRFLVRLGFTRENPEALRRAIKALALSAEAVEDARNEYGVLYCAAGALEGPTGQARIVTVWIRWRRDGTFHFVTLKPFREEV